MKSNISSKYKIYKIMHDNIHRLIIPGYSEKDAVIRSVFRACSNPDIKNIKKLEYANGEGEWVVTYDVWKGGWRTESSFRFS